MHTLPNDTAAHSSGLADVVTQAPAPRGGHDDVDVSFPDLLQQVIDERQ